MAPLKLVFAIAVAVSLGIGGVSAAPVGFLETGPKSLLVEQNQSPVEYLQYDEYPERDDDADLFTPEEFAPPTRPPAYRHPPEPAIYPPVYEWLPPPRPADCGEYHYWNGEYCADARSIPPYVGPRW
jgi:hypothetical protein